MGEYDDGAPEARITVPIAFTTVVSLSPVPEFSGMTIEGRRDRQQQGFQ